MSTTSAITINPAQPVVVDVRTPAEFMEGHLEHSVNIPLNQLLDHTDELRAVKDLTVCCASGVRSKKAAMLLAQNGIDSIDGGSWLNLTAKQ